MELIKIIWKWKQLNLMEINFERWGVVLIFIKLK